MRQRRRSDSVTTVTTLLKFKTDSPVGSDAPQMLPKHHAPRTSVQY